MLPLWYTLFHRWTLYGEPVVRPLFWDFLDDPETHENEEAGWERLGRWPRNMRNCQGSLLCFQLEAGFEPWLSLKVPKIQKGCGSKLRVSKIST